MMHVDYTEAATGKHFVEQAFTASWRDNENDYDFQNFVNVAAAECVGFRFINVDQLF